MNFSSLKHVNLAIFLAVSFTPHPSYAENSGWMKISKIKSYGRYLKRNHLIPFDIKCKRPNLAGGWTSGLFKVKTRSQLPDKVQRWRISATRISNSGIASQLSSHFSGQSRSVVRPGKSGVGIMCKIFHLTIVLPASATGDTYHKSIDKIPKGGHLA